MLSQIENALNASGFVSDVVEFDGYVEFRLNGANYWAKLSRGKFLEKNMRRG